MTRNQLITAILQEVLRINEQTTYAAFFTYSGHVDKVQVYIAKGKDTPDFSTWIWDQDVLMGPDFGDPIPALTGILNHLKTIV